MLLLLLLDIGLYSNALMMERKRSFFLIFSRDWMSEKKRKNFFVILWNYLKWQLVLSAVQQVEQIETWDKNFSWNFTFLIPDFDWKFSNLVNGPHGLTKKIMIKNVYRSFKSIKGHKKCEQQHTPARQG